jgi:hypothetical protein
MWSFKTGPEKEKKKQQEVLAAVKTKRPTALAT